MLKILRNLLINSLVVMIALTTMAISVSADWTKTKEGSKYTDESGKAVTGWQSIDKSKYYFNSKGIMSVGWLTMKGGSKYYFGEDGKMVTGWQTIDKEKYYFNKNGKMSTGIVLISKKIYLFSDTGAYEKMYKSEPCVIGDKLYYCKKDGTIAKGATKFKYDGEDYYFYFGKKGYSISTTVKVGKDMCTFDADDGFISKTPALRYQPSFTETNKHLTLTNFKLALKSADKYGYTYEYSGRIENFSKYDYDDVYIKVDLFDEDGYIIKSDYYLTHISRLLKDENADFRDTVELDVPLKECKISEIIVY